MIDQLAEKGWAIIKPFSDNNLQLFNRWIRELDMTKASIVRGDSDYRGDETYWLDDRDAVSRFIKYKMEQLKVDMNGRFFCGLKTIELHAAHYPPGTKYGKHLDVSKNGNDRVVSMVTYLNDNWTEEDGGQLRLYTNDGIMDIEPKIGTTILFLSKQMQHEVLTTQVDRYSITGWFRE